MRWRSAWLLVAAALCVSACGAQTVTSGGTAVTESTLSELKDTVAKASAVPTFTAPGPAIENVAALRGKVMAIPVASQLQTCEQVAHVISSIGQQVGTPVTVFDNDGNPSQWATGIQNAILGGYSAIILICGINPAAIAPQLQSAISAGIKVMDYGWVFKSPLISGATVDPYDHDMRVLADAALVQAGGKATDALVITANEVPSAPDMVKSIQDEFQKKCGSACHVTVVNVPVAAWSTRIQSTMSSSLLAHPTITTVIPIFAGMLITGMPAVVQSHRAGVHVFTFGQGNVELKMQTTPPGSQMIMADIGPSGPWAAYEAYYQTMLLLAGQQPMAQETAFTPNRNWTPGNINEYFSANGGYGTDFVNGFRKLLGLAPLSGSALDAAASEGNGGV